MKNRTDPVSYEEEPMRKHIFTAGLTLLALAMIPAVSYAHCQIPCGIYDDQTRIDLLNEHITTIEKAMNQIMELSGAGDKHYNQIVRWVTNKDDHAQQFQDIVTYYFLAQRIKPVDPGEADAYQKYLKKLEILHHMHVYAMKCKQTTDPANVEKLKSLVKEFADAYFEKAGKPAGMQ
jgi:nickel superoxide dismutase